MTDIVREMNLRNAIRHQLLGAFQWHRIAMYRALGDDIRADRYTWEASAHYRAARIYMGLERWS